ncbi:MAG: DUF2279 domain-containing protein [bacterium]
MMRLLLIIVFISSGILSHGQESISFFKPLDSLNTKRLNTVLISEASLITGGLIALNQLWYSDFEQSNFRTINDSGEWRQLDKFGHVYATYHLTRLSADAFKWSGLSKEKSNLYGAISSYTFMTAIEIFDGFSEDWGFSWYDMAANTLGTGLYLGQEYLWDEQRILLKYSFNRSKYAALNPSKLGDGFTEELFKDYNGQTYWLSFNLFAFTQSSFFPKWLNVAVGYGAEGMLNGRSSLQITEFNQNERYNQFYLSLDVDFTRIQTNSHFLKTLFSLVTMLKIPFPTLEINTSKGRNLQWQWY